MDIPRSHLRRPSQSNFPAARHGIGIYVSLIRVDNTEEHSPTSHRDLFSGTYSLYRGGWRGWRDTQHLSTKSPSIDLIVSCVLAKYTFHDEVQSTTISIIPEGIPIRHANSRVSFHFRSSSPLSQRTHPLYHYR